MRDANVLVVEDDETIRRLLVEYLKQHSYLNVEGARDGVEALHQLATGRYGVVVLDVMMPKMSGVDLLDSLEVMVDDPTVGKLQSTPSIVIITAAPQSAVPDSLFERRFGNLVRAVLRKPLDITRLVEIVEGEIRARP